MLREEAIKYLKEMKDECNDTFHKVRYVTKEEALDMAIKALEQEPSGDLISRQASISKIKELFSLGDCYCDEYSIVGTLNGMPSVKQEPKTGHWFAWKPEEDVWRTTCSECGEETRTLWDYCPHCGAKMVEPQESEEI